MTWLELHKLLKRECEQTHFKLHLALKAGKKFPDSFDHADHAIENVSAAADLACKYFAEHQKWPLVNPRVSLECFLRCQIAREFCKFVACPDSPRLKFIESVAKKSGSRYSKEELIEWVLVDYYWHAGMYADLYQERIEPDPDPYL